MTDLAEQWAGSWVADRLGVRLHTEAGPARLTELVGMAVRHNPRRAHLLVSTVLGKHLPADPRMVLAAGRLLGAQAADVVAGRNSGIGGSGGRLLRAALAGSSAAAAELLRECERHATANPVPAVVLGFAETATGLGHAVADALSAYYLHSTRRPVTGLAPWASFEEEHSHATRHLLLPEEPELLRSEQPLVLVDDELSTGRTACNMISALHRAAPGRRRYLVATLVDLRSEADRAEMLALADRLGVHIEVVALATGRLSAAADILERGRAIVEAYRPASAPPDDSAARPAGSATVLRTAAWPTGVREGGRHGFGPAHRPAFERAVEACAQRLAAEIGTAAPAPAAEVLVLGFEELMYAPLRIAVALADRLADEVRGHVRVRYSTTTRSPVLAVDEAGYAIRSRLEFPAHDRPADGPGRRYAYNVAPTGSRPGRFTDIVLVIDDVAETPELDVLVRQLSALTDRLHCLTIPSYRPVPVTGTDQGRPA